MTSFPVNPGWPLGPLWTPLSLLGWVGWGVYKQIITLGDVEYSNILSQFAERLGFGDDLKRFLSWYRCMEKYRASRGGKKTSKQRGCKIPPLTVDS